MVNWNILQPIDVGGAIRQGWETGVQQQSQIMERNALADLVKNPNDPNALNALARFNPQAAYQFQQQSAAAAKEKEQSQIRIAAAGGDPNARQQLAGFDFNAWSKLSEPDKELVKSQTSYIGQSALAISQLPPDQRAAAWDAYIDQGVRMGYTALAPYKGQYSEQALQGAIANAGLVENAWKADAVKYQVIPEGGTLQAFDSRTGAPVGPTNTTPPKSVPQPDAEDIQMLRNNPSMAAQFDEVFGQGAAQSILQGGQTPQASGNFQP